MTALGPGTGKSKMGKDHLDEEKVLLIARGKMELKIIGTDKAIWRQRGALIASSAMEGRGRWAASLPRAACCRGTTEPETGTGHHHGSCRTDVSGACERWQPHFCQFPLVLYEPESSDPS